MRLEPGILPILIPCNDMNLGSHSTLKLVHEMMIAQRLYKKTNSTSTNVQLNKLNISFLFECPGPACPYLD